jgi:hypothetical protein
MIFKRLSDKQMAAQQDEKTKKSGEEVKKEEQKDTASDLYKRAIRFLQFN